MNCAGGLRKTLTAPLQADFSIWAAFNIMNYEEKIKTVV
jgi:hypothetical protein